MEERKQIEEKELREIVEKFPGQHLGRFELKDGKLNAEQEQHLRASFTRLIEKLEPDEAKRAEAFGRLEQTLREVQDGGAMEWQLNLNIAKAKHALKRMEEGLLNPCEQHAKTLDQPFMIYQLGQAHGLLSAGMAAVEGALQRLDHALNCDCGGEAHGEEPEASERPTDPPPPDEAHLTDAEREYCKTVLAYRPPEFWSDRDKRLAEQWQKETDGQPLQEASA